MVVAEEDDDDDDNELDGDELSSFSEVSASELSLERNRRVRGRLEVPANDGGGVSMEPMPPCFILVDADDSGDTTT